MSLPRGKTASSDRHAWTEEDRCGEVDPGEEARDGEGDLRVGDDAAEGEAEADGEPSLCDREHALGVSSDGGGDPAEGPGETAEGCGEPPEGVGEPAVGAGEGASERRVSGAMSS